MLLTGLTEMTGRDVVRFGTADPGSRAADAVAALRWFAAARAPLPARTVLYVAGADGLGVPALSAVAGTAVRVVRSRHEALLVAHRELHTGAVDCAMIADIGLTQPDAVTVCLVGRADGATAGADGPRGPASTAPDTAAHDRSPAPDSGPARLFLWSGDDARDERRARDSLLALLDRPHEVAFRDLPVVIPPRPRRALRAAAVTTSAAAREVIRQAPAAGTGGRRPVGFLFPGQGSQHHAMAAGLYGHEPTFTAAIDEVLSCMGSEGPRIRADWLAPGPPSIGLDDVRRAQPLLLAVDYALARMVMSWGVRPAAVLGHSAGELVAAVIADVVSVRDAVTMVMERVRQALRMPAGGMLAVGASEEEVRPYLTADVVIAAVNTNRQTMLAGTRRPLAGAQARLREDGFAVAVVPATSPFHSPAMEPACEAVESAYQRVGLREPALPLYSGYTGELMSGEQALSPRFWARQITDTVHFRQALDQLLAVEDMLLVETGPRQTLTAFARRHRAVRLRASAVVPLLPARTGPQENDRTSVLAAAAALWTEGHDLDETALSAIWR